MTRNEGPSGPLTTTLPPMKTSAHTLFQGRLALLHHHHPHHHLKQVCTLNSGAGCLFSSTPTPTTFENEHIRSISRVVGCFPATL